jgi:hypothetical protein
VGTDFGRYRLPPFFGVVEYRINVKDDPAKRIESMFHHLTDRKLGAAGFVHGVKFSRYDFSA